MGVRVGSNRTGLFGFLISLQGIAHRPAHTGSLFSLVATGWSKLLQSYSAGNTIIASKIGRALRTTSDGKLAYVHKYNDDFWYLKHLEGASEESEIVARMPEGVEDFTVNDDGIYFCGSGSVLMMLDPAKSDQWRPIADLGIFGVMRITRLAVNSRGQIAVVSNQSS